MCDLLIILLIIFYMAIEDVGFKERVDGLAS